MVFKFRIISGENREFAREVLISSDQTFLDLHHCLQENLGYDPRQLSSFFITNALWEKQLQITLIDMMDDSSDDFKIMENTRLDEHLGSEGDRMLYVFDFFSERSFFIELTAVLDISKHKNLPKVVFQNGDPPEQIMISMDDDLPLIDDELNDDFMDGFSEDDLSDGFDFTDTEDLPDE